MKDIKHFFQLTMSQALLAIQNSLQNSNIFKGKLQRENKLISYERAFKMLENNMYISLESVKPFLNY